MKRGLDWYKREPRAIIDAKRASGMSCRQAAIYDILIDLIYEGGGETPDSPRYIAAHFSDIGQAAARRTIEELVAMGKIIRDGDMLTQKRAKNEAKTRQNLSETNAKNGQKGAVSRWESVGKPNEINDDAMASASIDVMAEKRREEKRREESPLPPQGGKREVEKEFEEWWGHVPRKVSKGAARRAFTGARKKAEFQQLLDGIKRFALQVQGKDAQYICHPSTWLNGERWADREQIDRPTEKSSPEVLLDMRVHRAEEWLSRHDTIPAWMDNLAVAEVLESKGHDYEALRRAGFSLPIRGRVVDISGKGPRYAGAL